MAKKKAKKRGVKPGTKRGPYKAKAQVKNTSINLADYNNRFMQVTEPPNILAMCGQLESTIDALAARLTSINARLNSLM